MVWCGVAVTNEILCWGEVESTVKVHSVRFLANLKYFQNSSLPESLCCPVDTRSLPVDAVVAFVHVSQFYTSQHLSCVSEASKLSYSLYYYSYIHY